jgi:ribosome modulation factor
MKKRAPRLEHPAAYYQGHADRQAGRCRLSQPYGHLTVDCGWWLAGWNDKDMEIQLEQEDSPRPAIAQAA